MTIKELRNKANGIAAKVRTNGDYDKTGMFKLWALFCSYTGERISPYYTLNEWHGKDIRKITLNYIAFQNGVKQ